MEVTGNAVNAPATWTAGTVRAVLQEAQDAADKAAGDQLAALQAAGPRWAVKDGSRTVGTLLDLCGFAWVKVLPANTRFCRVARTLGYLRKAYGGGAYVTVGRTSRQEISVNTAACRAAANVLQKYGVPAYCESRID